MLSARLFLMAAISVLVVVLIFVCFVCLFWYLSFFVLILLKLENSAGSQMAYSNSENEIAFDK